MTTRLAAISAITLPALLLCMGTPAAAHRLDEYLQAATLSLEPGRVGVQMRLTPGVAVFPALLAAMDTNGDGVLSDAEQRAYAQRTLGDLSLAVNGARLRPTLDSYKFATIPEMKAGRGDIQIAFTAPIPPAAPTRKLVFENRHRPRMAVYLVNCLVPRAPAIQVTGQNRNYEQSHYELDYTQAGVPSRPRSARSRPAFSLWAGAAGLLLAAPLAWLWRRATVGKHAAAQPNNLSVRETMSPEGGV